MPVGRFLRRIIDGDLRRKSARSWASHFGKVRVKDRDLDLPDQDVTDEAAGGREVQFAYQRGTETERLSVRIPPEPGAGPGSSCRAWECPETATRSPETFMSK